MIFSGSNAEQLPGTKPRRVKVWVNGVNSSWLWHAAGECVF